MHYSAGIMRCSGLEHSFVQESHRALPQASLAPGNHGGEGGGVTPAHWRRRARAARGGPQLSVCARATALRCALRSGSSLSRLLVPAMVLESVVADLLNRFLGDYVENLNKSQLKLGIWGGKRDATACRRGRGGCACGSLGTPGTSLGMPLLSM